MHSNNVRVFSAIVFGSGGFLAARIWYGGKLEAKTSPPPPPPSDIVDSPNIQQRGNEILGHATRVMKFGLPNTTNVRVFETFIAAYDTRTRSPTWVFEHLNRGKLYHGGETNRQECAFQEDYGIHPFFRATNDDFFKSGYDRGHLAAAGNQKTSQTNQCQTFFLSNIAPQIGKGFNRDSWNRLEKYVRFLTRFYKDVYVLTGSLFLPKLESDGRRYVKYEVLGRNHVAVPTHFYKVLLLVTDNDEYEIESYILPNQPIDNDKKIRVFQVPLDSIERAAGFLLFSSIPRDEVKRINGFKHEFNG